MSTIRFRHSPWCKVASNTATTIQELYEPRTTTPHSIPANELQQNLDKRAERNKSIGITTAGKPGVGTSTMINNFLDLEHDKNESHWR